MSRTQPSEVMIADIELKLLIEAVFLRYNYDFRSYSKASLKRRTQAFLQREDIPNIARLTERVLHDPLSFEALLQYVTIGTTEMFRDPHYFKEFREKVIPHLRTYPSIKIWIAGCSTGEEVYSFAILLEEEGMLERSLIYATDINAKSLMVAESGIYPIEQMRKATLNYQKAGGICSFSDYYSAAYQSAEINPRLKKHVVFADHSLATDSVFCEVQMVSCRNVLIYFNRELQDRALGLFTESLVGGGFLGLGEKETLRFSSEISNYDNFVEISKIYRRKHF